MAMRRFDWADVLAGQCRTVRLPAPQREYRPWKDRRFRIDLAWPEMMLYAECDGSEWTHGRHGRGAGMRADCEKGNRLALEGWTGFRFVGSQVKDGTALAVLERAFVQ